jgi:hypothetical protein
MTPNGSLIPTPVVDKNGRATTVHKKPLPPAGASAVLGAVPPTLTGAEAGEAVRPFYPTRKQEEQRHFAKSLRYDKIDRRLPNKGTDYEWVNFSASDLEMYDVFSVTRDNAIGMMLLNHGIRSAEDARTLMVSLDAENLIDDRSELAQKALTRRIDSAMMIEFSDYYNPALWHTGEHLDRYLDGVELYSFPKFQNRKGPLFSDILTGKIRLEDIKTIGVKTVANHFNDDGDLESLRSLADGSANYTAEHLRDACKTAGGDSFSYWMVQRMCKTHGGEWAAGINWMVGSAAQGQWRRGKSIGDEKEAITYAHDFHQKLGGKVAESIALYEAGVPLEFAVEKIGASGGFTVEQVIAMHEGVPASMTSGWI